MTINKPTDEQTLTIAEILNNDRKGRLNKNLMTAIIFILILLSLWQSGMFDGKRLSEGLPAIGVLISEMTPPNFTRWRDWIVPMLETITMSIAGTAIAIVLSLPLAFLASPNTTPNTLVYYVARLTLNTFRAIPELILGIIFVAAVGFGMLPGVLALGLHSIGMVGKFFAEAIEHAHPSPIEAAEAVGGTNIQVIFHGILPQVLPQFGDVSMYRWEYNFRQSTVMGMVGAGGIGTELIGSLRIMDYEQVSAILIVILASVTIVDGLSNILRKRLT
jgi:phosphonate transport system permease protein